MSVTGRSKANIHVFAWQLILPLEEGGAPVPTAHPLSTSVDYQRLRE